MRQELIFRIGGQQSVKEIQDWFSLQFPYVRINFFENMHLGPGVSGPGIKLLLPESLLKEFNPNMMDDELIIRDSTTVLALEIFFKERLGLSVQILRKSGNLWLDTARSNSWTLMEQNLHGREISPQLSNKTG